MGPVIGAGEDRFAVDHRELLVHETVFLVRPSGFHSGNTPHGNLLLFQKFAFGVSIIGVKLTVQDDLYRDATLPRLDQPAGQLIASKCINGDKQFLSRLFDFTKDVS